MMVGGLDRQTHTHGLPIANYSHILKPRKTVTVAHETRNSEIKQQITQEISPGLPRYMRT